MESQPNFSQCGYGNASRSVASAGRGRGGDYDFGHGRKEVGHTGVRGWEHHCESNYNCDDRSGSNNSLVSLGGLGRNRQSDKNGQPPKWFRSQRDGNRRLGRHGDDRDRQRSRNGDSRHSVTHLPYQPPKKALIISPESNTIGSSSAGGKSQSNHNDKNESSPLDLCSFPKLDPNDSTHARRIKQRRRQVLFGKNTAGYEEYLKQVPKHKRRLRSLDHPMTPDHTLDIPTKRWQGLMNAWRRSLHKFDPPDLSSRQQSNKTITLAPRPILTEQDKVQEEITQAKAAGLQVAFGSMSVAGGEFGRATSHEFQGNGGDVNNMAKLFSVDVAPNPVAPSPAQSSIPAEAMSRNSISSAQSSGLRIGEMTMDEEEAYQRTMNDSDLVCESALYDDTGASRVMMMGEHKQNRRSAMVAVVKRGEEPLLDDGNDLIEGLNGKADYSFLEEGCNCDSDDDVL